jgi:hypothetical protein
MSDLSGAHILRLSLVLAFTGLLALPVGSAWTLAPPSEPRPETGAAWAAWTTDLAPRAPGDLVGQVVGAAACALGDVTGDGIADLVVLVAVNGGGARLEALAGPDFQRVVWSHVTDLQRTLRCAPDLDLDGTLDPVLQTLGKATGTAAAGAVDQTRQQVQQTLEGATGAALIGRVDTQAVTGVAGSAAGAAQQATSALLPAAAGAEALLQSSGTQAVAQLPAAVEGALPVQQLTATAKQAAQLQILDAAGAVVSTVSIDEAGVAPLALAPVQLTGSLPEVAALSTAAISPVEQAAAGVPKVALYAADGTLAWTTQLPASTGIPLLVPNAGDLNLDGVGDLVVTTVQQQVGAVPGAAFTVLSGVDGKVLFTSGAAVSGLVAALPLGELPAGPALLKAVNAQGAASLTLSAIGGTGSVLWSVDVDKLAEPVNVALDPYTGEVRGFTDLTGDAVADVAVAVPSAGGMVVKTINGATGAVVWDLTVPAVSQVVPVVVGLAQASAPALDASVSVAAVPPGLAGVASHVQEVAAGASSQLLAIGNSTTNATLALIDAATGQVVWTAVANLPAGLDLASLGAHVAGDLDGDHVQDLLVTATVNATGDAPVATVAAVSGATGNTLWTNATSPAAPSGLNFTSTLGPASAGEAKPVGKGAPGPEPMLIATVLVVAVALRRRRLP